MSNVVATAGSITIEPIADADVDDVAAYLERNMTSGVTAEQWAAAMRAPWQHDAPNHGFHLRIDGTVGGAYVALYSNREIDEQQIAVCNLGAWCVDDAHRFQGVRLLQRILAQPGFVFTDLSPSGNVIALNRRLGFTDLDVTTALMLNVPRRSGGVELITELDEIARQLDGVALRCFEDHREAPAITHVLLRDGSATCHVMYRRVRRKRLPLFASVVYVSARATFVRLAPRLRSHLCRRAIPVLLWEERICGPAPRRARRLSEPRPKMFKCNGELSEVPDDLYSEMVAVPW